MGENVGFGEAALGTPLGLIQAWWASTTHRVNLLDRAWKDVGLGIAPGIPRQSEVRRDLHDRLRRRHALIDKSPLFPGSFRNAGRGAPAKPQCQRPQSSLLSTSAIAAQQNPWRTGTWPQEP